MILNACIILLNKMFNDEHESEVKTWTLLSEENILSPRYGCDPVILMVVISACIHCICNRATNEVLRKALMINLWNLFGTEKTQSLELFYYANVNQICYYWLHFIFDYKFIVTLCFG